MIDTILQNIDGMSNEIVELQKKLVSIPALGPDNGGDGEKEKTDFVMDYVKALGITDIREMNAPDERVSCGYRPNFAAIIPGEDTSRTFWIISHIDIVPTGEPTLWSSDPFELKVEGDKIIGRGVEDNNGGTAPSLVLAKSIMEAGATPPMNLGLIFVADEETNSHYGLGYVADKHADMFKKDDLFLIPDFGTPEGDMIEIAEKSSMWVKVSVFGKQCHASTPDEGVNSLVAASAYILRVKEIEEKFNDEDPLFDPARSTFAPTQKLANVENVNTIPGKDVFYVDCRILPKYDLGEVQQAFHDLARLVESEYGVRIEAEVVQGEQAAPPTSMDAEIVKRLAAGVKEVYGVEGRPAGIGGGTVAAILRRAGFDCAVWATCQGVAHQPNEYSLISRQVGDAKVMAKALFG